MSASYYGNRHLNSYRVVFFNADGTINGIKEVDYKSMMNVENNIIVLTKVFPITKAFIPQKKINIRF
jgi:hypothetical protein